MVNVRPSKRRTPQTQEDRVKLCRYRSLVAKVYRRTELLKLKPDGMVIGRRFNKWIGVGPPKWIREYYTTFMQRYIFDLYTSYCYSGPAGFLNGQCPFAKVMDWAGKAHGDHFGGRPYIDQFVNLLEQQGKHERRPVLPPPLPPSTSDLRRALPMLRPSHVRRALRCWPVHRLLFTVPAGVLDGPDSPALFKQLAKQLADLINRTFQRLDRRIGFIVVPHRVPSPPSGHGPVGLLVLLSQVSFRKRDNCLFDLAWNRLGDDSLPYSLAWFRHPPISTVEAEQRLVHLRSDWHERNAAVGSAGVFLLPPGDTPATPDGACPRSGRKLLRRLGRWSRHHGFFHNKDHRYSRLLRQLQEHGLLDLNFKGRRFRHEGPGDYRRLCKRLGVDPDDHDESALPHKVRTLMPMRLPDDAMLTAVKTG
jgi:hypothetical protein